MSENASASSDALEHELATFINRRDDWEIRGAFIVEFMDEQGEATRRRLPAGAIQINAYSYLVTNSYAKRDSIEGVYVEFHFGVKSSYDRRRIKSLRHTNGTLFWLSNYARPIAKHYDRQ